MRLTPLLFFAAAPLIGCFPAVSVHQPAITGRAVDSAGRPINRAAVTVSSGDDGVPVASTSTDAGGRFSQPAGEGRWFVYFLPQDNPPDPVYSVTVSSGQASGKAADVTGGQVKPFGLGFTRSVDVGTVLVR